MYPWSKVSFSSSGVCPFHPFLQPHGARTPEYRQQCPGYEDRTARRNSELTRKIVGAARSRFVIGSIWLLCVAKPMQVGGIRPGG
jgi:hypothetical protein